MIKIVTANFCVDQIRETLVHPHSNHLYIKYMVFMFLSLAAPAVKQQTALFI